MKHKYYRQYISLLERHVPASITDTDGTIVYVSEAFCDITGYTRDELIGKKHSILRHSDMSNEVYKNLWETITQGKIWHGQLKNKNKNYNSFWVDVYVEPIFFDGLIVGYQAVRKNITNEKTYKQLASTDTLTGLYNRHATEQFTQSFIDESRRYQLEFSIIMIDIDDFKHVNDTYGHQAGDSVIKKLVEIFLKLIRVSDRMGRWGGEEFVVLLPQTSYNQAFELAQRLRVGFSTYKFENIGHKTASFGVATLEEGDTISSLIEKSDKALYLSKNLGKNRVS